MFNIFKRLNKLLACFLTALLLMSNTVALVPVYAAASANTSEQTSELPEITLDKQVEDQFQNKQNADTATLSTKEKVVQFINQLIPYYAQNGKQQGPEWLRTTDINLTFTEDFKPIYSLETLQPFTKEVTDGKLGFWQGRYAYQSGANSTANLGMGLRWLSEDKTSITGVNAFYDYAFQHDLSRVGVGAEYFNKQAEYRANFYIPTSGDRQTGRTALADGILYSYIRAVSGFDYEVGTSLANVPWFSLYASGFHYDNKHKEDENGYRLRSKMQLTPRLSMEMGYTNSNLSSGSLYGKVLYQLADTAGPALHGGNPQERSNDISHKILQKVQRENDIKTETFTKFVAYTGSLSVTVTNGSGAALQDAQVQAYQNGSPVGAVAITDANGIAVLSGLDAGDYTVRASYFSISSTSSAVIVQKDQTTTVPPIALAILGGKAFIHVLDEAGADVGGATVTAETADGLYGAADKSLFDRILGVKTAYAAAGFKVTAVTNASGIATFPNLPPGNYKFTVAYSGKEMKSLAVSVADGSTSNSTVVLPASGGNIVAMIIDAVSKAVINGAAVELKSGSNVIDTKTTGSDGTAVFSGLTAGSTYTVAASAANYSGKSVNTAVADKETVAAAIALTPQGGGANITVKDDSNAPLSGAAVSVTVNGQPQTAVTDDYGVAAFTNLPVGTYTFIATKADYNSNTISTTITGGSIATADVTLTRQTGGAKITVTDGTAPLSGVAVKVTVNGQEQTATTVANGEATFANIPTGTYTFTATKADYGSGTASDVVIANGTTATAAIALARQTGNAKITVTDGTAPLSGVTVKVTLNGQEQTATTAANGEVIFANIPTGTYTFTATKADYVSGTASDVVIANGATATSSIALTRQTGGAKITVTDGDNPISGITVSVTVNGQVKTETTNAQGEATFTSIPTGQYTFTATSGYDSKTAVVTIAADTPASTTITLPAMGSVDFIVTSGSGPVPGAKISVTVNGSKIDKNSGADGKVSFTNLPVGNYTFDITCTGYESKSQSVTISRSITGNISLTINKIITAQVNVKDDAEKNVWGASVRVTGNGVDQTKTTDSYGNVSFSVPAGDYTFTTTCNNYNDDSKTISISEENNSVNLTIVHKVGDLTLIVKDSKGQPISGAEISESYSNPKKVLGYSGADGKFTLTKVPTNVSTQSYFYTALKDGYQGMMQGVTVNEGTNEQVIVLDRLPGKAQVTVKSGTNTLQGATVTLEGGTSKTTNVYGYARFESVPSGEVTFTASMTGYASNTVTATIAPGAGTYDPYTLVEIKLTPLDP
ncbi:hypothetical protein SDC9_03962 [bioreactor metagenome]|uniref:Inverse autotransporter beta-domain domain-containing protein n=1 Tax=bioreactor metagenome TaxID=1076179 RepID=A0A644SUS1_9ZZZZ|nr:carboxypeptidase regulatory-like domain-containing protein [Negativicutes bacterium]